MTPLTFCEASLYIDDVWTTEKGHYDLEYSIDYYKDMEKEYDPETEEYTKDISKELEHSIYLSGGITQNWDIGITVPYQYQNNSTTGKVNGFSDVILETKYRLWEEGKFFPAFAFYADFKTDSANADKSLGTGEKDYGLNCIFTKSLGKSTFDVNLGYVFVGAKAPNILYYACDWTYSLTPRISICNEFYGESTLEGNSDKNVFMGGFSLDFQINSYFSFESGVGFGITRTSPDLHFSNTFTLSF